MHVVQTFLSVELSEEVQIQGRTARQGKPGSYSLILLEDDLEPLGIPKGAHSGIARSDMHEWLNSRRNEHHAEKRLEIEERLTSATTRDSNSHVYFDALLRGDARGAVVALEALYADLETSAPSQAVHAHFVVDVSGSMDSPTASGRTRMDDAKGGINYIVSEVLDATRGDSISLTSFDDFVYPHLVDSAVDNKARITQIVNGLHPKGGTMLYTAFLAKLENLLVTVEADPTVKHYLFVFTDGEVSSPALSLAFLIPPRPLSCLSDSPS